MPALPFVYHLLQNVILMGNKQGGDGKRVALPETLDVIEAMDLADRTGCTKALNERRSQDPGLSLSPRKFTLS